MELIRNGGFEQEPDGVAWALRGRAEVTTGGDIAYAGSKCLRLAESDYVYQDLRQIGSVTYSSDGNVSCWVRNIGDADAFIGMYVMYASSVPEDLGLARTLFRVDAHTDWRRLDKPISRDLALRQIFLAGDVGNVLIDEVSASGHRLGVFKAFFRIVFGRLWGGSMRG